MINKKNKSSYIPQFFIGSVFHKRFSPKIHQFKYNCFYVKFSLFSNNKVSSPLFSFNKFNFLSFYNKDHGHRDGSDLKKFAIDKLQNEKVEDIIIHTMPRILGYVFNPVSFWYCYDNNKNLLAILAEVNNTFGETHTYVLDPMNLNDQKFFQVSPFYQIQGRYEFTFNLQEDYENVQIQYYEKDQLSLVASVQGRPRKINLRNSLFVIFNYPFFTFLVIFLIHFQALKLFIKGIPFYGKNGVINDPKST
jgi:DUF1365 family protein